MANLNCKKPKPCQPIEKPKEIYPSPTAPFEQCVGDYKWTWDGTRLTRTRTRTTPDGTYTSLSLVDGCVVAYNYANEPTYTPPYCNPNPTPCQQGGTSTDVTISNHRDNTLVMSTSGLFARTYLSGGNNVQVSGTGTQNNPYVVAFDGATPDVTVVGENNVETRTSNGVTYVGLSRVGTKGVYGGFTVNEYGQITAVSDILQSDDGTVKAGAGLVASQEGDFTIIGHTEADIPTTAIFGGMAVKLNKSGHITELERLTTITAGTYKIGAYNIAINEYGGVQQITQSDDVPEQGGAFTTKDNKLVRYDETGRITDIDDLTEAVATDVPLPIRDMFRLTISRTTSTNVEKEAYGNDTTLTNITDTSFSMQMPSYVTSVLQVSVNGAVSHTLQGNQLRVVFSNGVITNYNRVVTITLRG